MVQHVFVVMGIDGKPTAQPPILNIYRDDQSINWKILIPDWGWDNAGPGGGNNAIIFKPKNDPPWTGSVPAPVGPIPGIGLDQRLYTARGPGPNMGDGAVKYAYDMYVTDVTGHHHHRIRVTDEKGIPVDPDISNQPQP